MRAPMFPAENVNVLLNISTRGLAQSGSSPTTSQATQGGGVGTIDGLTALAERNNNSSPKTY